MKAHGPRQVRAETILVGLLFVMLLIPALWLAYEALEPQPPADRVENCAIHAHDQAEVGACLERGR